MVDCQISGFAGVAVCSSFWLAANKTYSALGIQHLNIFLGSDAKLFPLAFFYVMRMAKTIGIINIVAPGDTAVFCWFFTISVNCMPMSQKPLIVHGAKTLGFYRVRTTILTTAIGNDPLPHLNNRLNRHSALVLHIVGLTITTGFV